MIREDKPTKPVGETRLSKSVTVDKYKQLEEQEDKRAIAAFIVERFDERYFNPVMNSRSKHGFTMMAIGCLVIETLESFYHGWRDSSGKNPFDKFFKRQHAEGKSLGIFAGDAIKFHQNIRNGILHQAETKGGWMIRRSGDLLDLNGKTINADRFIRELRKTVAEYADQLHADPIRWENFKKKMKQVCANCERGEAPASNNP